VKVSVLYFGILREKLRLDREELELSTGTTVAALMDSLAERHSLEALGAGRIRAAVNCEYADASDTLGEGDEVAVIPPVSGG
jgi:molybdopterin converting factor subunit 1